MRTVLRRLALPLLCGLVVSAAAHLAEGQVLTTLHTFSGSDGSAPAAGLIEDRDGALVGTTPAGGALSGGTVFRLTPDGVFTTLYEFDAGSGGAFEPRAGLVQGTDGDYYGTTHAGGDPSCVDGCGTVFRLTPAGALTILHAFTGADGSKPATELVEGADGNFYGTTPGTAFRITPDGVFTTLYTFSEAEGAGLDALVEGTDGNFYGVASGGGATATCRPPAGCGTVFRLTPAGVLTVLHVFSGSDGALPGGALVEGADGNFYGTATSGGATSTCRPPDGCGTVFRLTPAGVLTTLHAFTGADGDAPRGLTPGPDDTLYGATARGGQVTCSPPDGCGTIFRLSAGGMLDTLHRFSGTDGRAPQELVQHTDGMFYGATSAGGPEPPVDGLGTLFRLALPPVLDPLTGPVQVGGSNTLTGRGFTPGSVVMVFIATSGGAISSGPYAPSSVTATSLDWTLPAEVPLGNGFCSVQVSNADQDYVQSNVVSALMEGNPAAGIPTILFIDGVGLAPPDPGTPLAHIDTVVDPGGTVTITGTGFSDPVVNLFTAAGSVGPLTPLPGGTETQIQVTVPDAAPIGPGNFQVVNRTNFRASNAVATVIGAVSTITRVTVIDALVTVEGTGFTSSSVVNLFARVGGVTVNLGGLGPAGPRLPFTVVDDMTITFTRPAEVEPGRAFVEVVNPPFTAFSSSGNDPDGAFTFPVVDPNLIVDDDGLASAASCDDSVPAHATIGSAVSVAVAGDTVRVCPGTYRENVDFLGKTIAVLSREGPGATTIDGGGAGPVVVFHMGEGRASRLAGFTLTNGDPGTSGFLGGGISISGASPTITGNRITGNRSCDGSAIDVQSGSPLISGNFISGNTQDCASGIGGAISIVGAAFARVVDNTITGNTSTSGAGGIACEEAGAPTIRGNVIVGNVGDEVGGISLGGLSDALIAGNLIAQNRGTVAGGVRWVVPPLTRGPRLVNNTVADNDGPGASGIVADGSGTNVQLIGNLVVAGAGQPAVVCGLDDEGTVPAFSFNDVFAASGVGYGGLCTDQTGLNGNIAADPLFVDPGGGDFHLRSGSPAIDAGNNSALSLPSTDIEGDPRIFDGNFDGVATVDIGADEFTDLIATFSLSRAQTSGCLTVTGRLTLLAPAPAGGLEVALSSDNPNATVPASVTVREGETERSFPVDTTAVAGEQTAVITATVPYQDVRASLVIKPMTTKSTDLVPNPVVGGTTVAGVVTLQCAAGPGDIVVALGSSKPDIAAPTTSSVTVPAGATSAPFEVTTTAVTAATRVAIEVEANGVKRAKTLTVEPAP